MAISESLQQLARQTPAEPMGWFRWIHCGYIFHKVYPSDFREHRQPLPDGIPWDEVEHLLGNSPATDPETFDAILEEAERHAWAFGREGLFGILDSLWEHLSPSARGKAFAGASEERLAVLWDDVGGNLGMEWLAGKWGEDDLLAFDGTVAAQLAINLILNRRHDLLGRVLESAPEWGGDVVGRRTPNGKISKGWAERLDPLSTKAIDRCLEAAVIAGDAEGGRLCLAAGADPNLDIFCLERSYNRKYCALSYVADRYAETGFYEVLREAGADPDGTDYSRDNPAT
jgi:hypothetical protein